MKKTYCQTSNKKGKTLRILHIQPAANFVNLSKRISK